MSCDDGVFGVAAGFPLGALLAVDVLALGVAVTLGAAEASGVAVSFGAALPLGAVLLEVTLPVLVALVNGDALFVLVAGACGGALDALVVGALLSAVTLAEGAIASIIPASLLLSGAPELVSGCAATALADEAALAAIEPVAPALSEAEPERASLPPAGLPASRSAPVIASVTAATAASAATTSIHRRPGFGVCRSSSGRSFAASTSPSPTSRIRTDPLGTAGTSPRLTMATA